MKQKIKISISNTILARLKVYTINAKLNFKNRKTINQFFIIGLFW